MRPPFRPERFAANRARLLANLEADEAVLLFGTPLLHRNSDSEHRYRPSSDVHYLTGWEDPEVAVLLRHGEPGFVLFVQARDPEREVWDGFRAGPEGAVSTYGATRAFPIGDLEKELPDLLLGIRVLHYRFAVDAERDRQLTRAIARARNKARRETWQEVPDTFVDPDRKLHELRLHKTAEELELLRRAAAITRDAHVAAMAMTAPGVHEYELQSLIDSTFLNQGGDGPGYASIIGAGVNATVLHYRANRDAMRDGDLVCVDAGCEYGWYTADVTRTWPVNGRFSEAQRELYGVVLDVQKAIVDAVSPGVSWRELSEQTNRLITEGLVRVGLLEGEVEKLIEEKAFKRYYMHGIGHWLGMDVHDVGAYVRGGQSRPLAPGQVITVEPGIYVPANDEKAPERFRGLGIRIEDDVLVTDTGREVLTADIPKEIADVEAACGQKLAAK